MKPSVPAAIELSGRLIGAGHPPFVLAEMSANHNGSLERAMKIVEAAHRAGVDGLKLQTYTADTMTLDLDCGDFVIDDPGSPWQGETLYSLYEKAHTPWEWHRPIMDRCRQLGLVCFSTPFDASAVDFLETLNVPAYKIASFENTDLPLIRRVAATGKPLIVSTGMGRLEEIRETVDTARCVGCRDLILLQCTSTYPASPAESHIRNIADMRDRFRVNVGLSDHTQGIGSALASVALGACLIEKHFTLDRDDGGPDAAFSLNVEEMARLVVEVRTAWFSLGKVHYGPTDAEKGSLKFRRSLYFVQDLAMGERIESRHIRAIRPGYGLAPKFFDQIVGRRVAESIRTGTPVSWDLILPDSDANC